MQISQAIRTALRQSTNRPETTIQILEEMRQARDGRK
jgi:hypothetical protein